jgi:hypothetical protein
MLNSPVSTRYTCDMLDTPRKSVREVKKQEKRFVNHWDTQKQHCLLVLSLKRHVFAMFIFYLFCGEQAKFYKRHYGVTNEPWAWQVCWRNIKKTFRVDAVRVRLSKTPSLPWLWKVYTCVKISDFWVAMICTMFTAQSYESLGQYILSNVSFSFGWFYSLISPTSCWTKTRRDVWARWPVLPATSSTPPSSVRSTGIGWREKRSSLRSNRNWSVLIYRICTRLLAPWHSATCYTRTL